MFLSGFSRYGYSNLKKNLAALPLRRRKRITTGERATTTTVRSILMETSMTMRMKPRMRKTRDSRMTNQQEYIWSRMPKVFGEQEYIGNYPQSRVRIFTH